MPLRRLKIPLRPIAHLCAALLCLQAASLDASSSERQPNLVIIMADDLGFGDLSGYGSEKHETPNLDRLASEGLRLDNFYMTSSVCTPARVALLTGRHPARVGFSEVLWPTDDGGLPESELTLPEMLRSRGYVTGLAGKWHLGHSPSKYLPLNHGFDYFYGMPYPNDMGPMHIQTQYRDEEWPPMPMMRGNEIVEAPIDVNLLTQQYTSAAGQFIAENHHRPFFLFLAHAMPHTIIGASPDFKGTSKNGLYGDAIQEIDWSVGEIMRLLRIYQLEENTLVIFTSDNGAVLPAQYGGNEDFAKVMHPDMTFGSNGPLRGGKQSTFEGGIRVPGIFYWKGFIEEGSSSSAPTWVADIMPTFLDLAGIALPQDREYDGQSLARLLRGEEQEGNDRPLFFGRSGARAMREGNWKLVLPVQPRFLEQSDKPMLFDLSADIAESEDLAPRDPERVAAMLERLKEWEAHAQADPISR